MADNAQKEHQAGDAAPPALTALVKASFAGQFLASHTQHGDETIIVKREGMLELFRFLRDDERCRFNMMIDLTAVDFLPRKPRFEVVYHFKSTILHHRLRVKIPLEMEEGQNPEVDSIEGLWVAADWYERECWEMYGIGFKGHPELKQLLLYEGFEGYPLRKDYNKLLMQPLVPMRTVRERNDYGEIFQYVQAPSGAPLEEAVTDSEGAETGEAPAAGSSTNSASADPAAASPTAREGQ